VNVPSRTERLRRLLVGAGGYTLTEALTVMAILSIVIGGLTAMFHAGMRTEVRSLRELQAQQNARAALDKMRRELHCANALTTPDGTTVTVTLPASCPGPDTSVTYATVNVAANRYKLTRTPGAGTPVDVADYLIVGSVFTYYPAATGTLARLSVDIPVNLDPADTKTLWRLQDDIVLRNTVRL
jgi:type II secretory pathway pseudopilin PulG